MTIICSEPAAPSVSAEDPERDAETAASADCARMLEEAGLDVAFGDRPDGAPPAAERPEPSIPGGRASR